MSQHHSTLREAETYLVPGTDEARVARGRAEMLDGETYQRIGETFRALGDPTRAKIIYSLLRQELCTCDLAAITGYSESAVSQHLRVLRQLRLVKSRREGRLVHYSLDDAHISLLLAVCLSHVRDGDDRHPAIEPLLAHFAVDSRGEEAGHA